LDVARGFTSFSSLKNSDCMRYGELALMDLCVFEYDKIPNVLDE
jgi:hypothetical protein